MTAPALTVLAILADPSSARVLERTFRGTGDRVLLVTDLTEGLAIAASEKPDLAFVDISLGHNAGLALVHHLKAVVPTVVVYALSRPESLAIGAQAVALGGAGLVMMPPSGDELLSAASDVRGRLASEKERRDLRGQTELAKKGSDYAARMTELATSADRADAAGRLAMMFLEMTGALGTAVYLPAIEGVNELVRTSTAGEMPELPAFVDEMGLLTFAVRAEMTPVPLVVGRLSAGHVLVHCTKPAEGSLSDRFPGIELMATQAAFLLAYLVEKERSARGSIKDFTTSAYTFAYFVDIAGREIEKSRRYDRRFALATIALEEAVGEASNELAEGVLSVVRDTDVLARVDEREFYLLMPETGGVGAQSCRRRVLAQARPRVQSGAWDLSVGVATYPHDGRDLSRLLRAAKHRAKRSRFSVVRAWNLEDLGLVEIVNTLLMTKLPEELVHDPDAPRTIDLGLADAVGIALTAVDEAARGGLTTVAVAHHPGFGLSSSVRTSLEHDRETVVVHSIDLRNAADCDDLQLLAVFAEHGGYLLMGRSEGGILRGVHASDPLLVDLMAQRLGQTAGIRLLE